ncbi:VanZ family protein [Lactobacillus sp. Sy-1]|uniref:VanZ family protein n=1 Tax=Lactobacillus sp. Sy-1 TaxID=2109645 RepID=UPI001C5875ED|nr:VanZ family protein [Lactobacillus sp. Sy-1]MBW1605102.1 VanZ family protein [Lactobacillus sp. Sy-1]
MTNLNHWQLRVTQGLLVIYLMIVALLCFTPRFPIAVQLGSYPELSSFTYGHAQIVYMPFQELLTEGFWLNVAMTIPLGGFVMRLNPHPMTISAVVGLGALTGGFIEFGQLFLDNLANFQRTVDINDVISNLLGVVIGYYLTKLIIGGIKQWQN